MIIETKIVGEFLSGVNISNWSIDSSWLTFILGVILTIILFAIDYRSGQRDKKIRARQDEIENEFRRQHQQQLEHTTEIVESIKATLTGERRHVFEENLSVRLYRQTRDNLIKFKTLWEGYLADNMMRLHGRLEREIAILGRNMIDLASRAASTLPEEDAQKIRDMALEYDRFSNWLGTLGDKQRFDEAGNKIMEKTNALLEIINPRIEAN